MGRVGKEQPVGWNLDAKEFVVTFNIVSSLQWLYRQLSKGHEQNNSCEYVRQIAGASDDQAWPQAQPRSYGRRPDGTDRVSDTASYALMNLITRSSRPACATAPRPNGRLL